MLTVINFMLIVIIIAVSITNSYMIFKLRDNVKQRMSSLSADVSLSNDIARQAIVKAQEKTEQVQSTTYTPPSISLTDLKEFDNLDPNTKNFYKKYVVGNFMPRIINKLNQTSATPNAQQALDQVGQALVSMSDEQLFAKAKTNSAVTVRSSAVVGDSPQQVTYIPQSISLADLQEFDRLDPNAKNLYKKYVVGNIMPRMFNKLNQESLTPNAIQAFDKLGQTLVSMSDEQLFANAKKNTPFTAQPALVEMPSQPQSSNP